jgi:hypothetical protein
VARQDRCRDRGDAGEAAVNGPDHYEVELREMTYEDDGAGGLQVTGSMWKPVRVFDKDMVPMPLTFEALSAAQAYVGRNQPGAVRIVRVTEDGKQQVVETGCL